MALRRNKDTGAWERQQDDGTWSVVAPPGAPAPVGQAATAQLDAEDDGLGGLDAALQSAFNGHDARSSPEATRDASATAVAPEPAVPVSDAAAPTGPAVPADEQVAVAPEAQASALSPEATDASNVDFDIPGLTSADSSRSTSGSRAARERLMARRGTGGRAARTATPDAQVVVGERAARVSGPAAREGTEVRSRARAATGRRAQVADGGAEPKTQRYVTKPPPGLLGSRPKWVQELFEAHFRSDYTLQMRRDNNRMKISRQDYAIGWLTLFDKIREEPAIVRAKGAV